MKQTTRKWVWRLPWIVTGIALFLFSVRAMPATVPAVGSGTTWQVSTPANAQITAVRLNCFDCDVADEGTLTVDGVVTPLFGADVAANDQRNVEIVLPGNTLPAGDRTLTFAFTRRAGAYRIDGIAVDYEVPTPRAPWLETAERVLVAGWVPAWLTEDDAVWVVSREDTEPARVLVCATDGATGARFATWIEDALERLPEGAPPAADACARAWCFASGAGRAAEIGEACS